MVLLEDLGISRLCVLEFRGRKWHYKVVVFNVFRGSLHRRVTAQVSFSNSSLRTLPSCLRIPFIGAQFNHFQALVILP
ncbi:hypothetical protein RchiOBHm_Chr5g0069951 [Rosa chinensis]|uniref:Uncharacterized protein n=1 Tax=Rosa chinensis TaxID=74649 RepID=A0A2P6QK29_ROSCH|nr:hypothetical protein RchiOBHm_Chr5g0069951 [Rosa chinensis]